MTDGSSLGTTTDEIQQVKLVENAERAEQAVRRSALTGRSPVTQVQVAERTAEKTVEILQVKVH